MAELEQKHLSPTELANRLRVSRQYILKCLLDGKIKGIKLGKVWRISAEEVERIEKEGI